VYYAEGEKHRSEDRPLQRRFLFCFLAVFVGLFCRGFRLDLFFRRGREDTYEKIFERDLLRVLEHVSHGESVLAFDAAGSESIRPSAALMASAEISCF
jgi:hypothetical protein